ncbi:MAG: DNA repair protein RecO [candidate division WOR-3 bacterium]
MTAPLNTEAVCLYYRTWRNTSLILSLFTRELGLVSALAKGARRPRSRLGAVTGLFTHCSALLLPPRAGELYILTDADLLNPFSRLNTEYERLLEASVIAEFLLRTLPPRHPEERVFALLLTYLDQLAQPAELDPGTIRLLVLSFLLKALAFLGYRPELVRCSRCGQELSPPVVFNPETGDLVCIRCRQQLRSAIRSLGAEQLQLLRTLLHTPAVGISRLAVPGPDNTLTELVAALVSHHYPHRTFPLLVRLSQPQK